MSTTPPPPPLDLIIYTHPHSSRVFSPHKWAMWEMIFSPWWSLTSCILEKTQIEIVKKNFSNLEQVQIALSCVSWEIHDCMPGLSLRFQVAGYLLLVAGKVASIHGRPNPRPLTPQEVFEVQLLPFFERHYRPEKAIFIKSTAIISGFMMITYLLKKTATFWDTKIISFYFT